MLRKKFARDMDRRFNRLKGQLRKLIAEEDAFGLRLANNEEALWEEAADIVLNHPAAGHDQKSHGRRQKTGLKAPTGGTPFKKGEDEWEGLVVADMDVNGRKFRASVTQDTSVQQFGLTRRLGAQEFDFEDENQRTDVTGKGDAVKVFRRVTEQAMEAIEKHSPEGLVFGAAKDAPSRVSLYAALARRATKFLPGYKGVKFPNPNGDFEIFAVVRKDAKTRVRINPRKVIELEVLNHVVHNTRFAFVSTPEQVQLFRAWLQRQIDIGILARSQTTGKDWIDEYIEEGYRRGQGAAFDKVRKPALAGSEAFYQGTKSEFLRSSFGKPVARRKLELLMGRTMSDLQGVTEAMATQIQRELTDGLVTGLSPLDIARNISNRVDKIGITRARTIARTEIIRAHAEGNLDAMEELGVEQVSVAVEWSTAEDGKVCPKCKPLEGVVLQIKDAHGMFPRHPNCRCSPIPANVGEDATGQVRDLDKIKKRIAASVKAELPRKSRRSVKTQRSKSKWVGAGKRIRKPPKPIV